MNCNIMTGSKSVLRILHRQILCNYSPLKSDISMRFGPVAQSIVPTFGGQNVTGCIYESIKTGRHLIK